jgi:hypothetical protein
MRRRLCSCFALALGLPLGALNAQDAPALAPGTRVRVTAPDGWREVGSLEAIDSATIFVRLEVAKRVAFPREPGTRLEASGPGSCSGPKRGRCIGLGFLAGAAVGAVTGLIIGDQQRCTERGDCAAYLVAAALPGALLGIVVGAVVGGGENWKSTPIPARLSLGPDGSGRFAFGLSVAF